MSGFDDDMVVVGRFFSGYRGNGIELSGIV